MFRGWLGRSGLGRRLELGYSYHIILTRLFNDDPPAIGIDKAKDKECGENEDGKVLVALSDAKVSLLDH